LFSIRLLTVADSVFSALVGKQAHKRIKHMNTTLRKASLSARNGAYVRRLCVIISQ
jgi:hypothetical protein